MLKKDATREGGELSFVTIRNVEASSITANMAVAMRVATAASFNGVNAVMADSTNTGDMPLFMGIATSDIASNDYGLVQTGGPVASVLLSNVGSSLTIANGAPLVPGAAPGSMFSAAPTYANCGFKFIIASNVPVAVSDTGYCSGYIRFI